MSSVFSSTIRIAGLIARLSIRAALKKTDAVLSKGGSRGEIRRRKMRPVEEEINSIAGKLNGSF